MRDKVSIIIVVCLVVSLWPVAILAYDDGQEVKPLKQISEKWKYITGHPLTLYNQEGTVIAEKRHMYEKPPKLARTIIKDGSGNIIYEFEYDSEGKAVNPKWLCLDKEGNIIKEAGKPILVNPFEYKMHMPIGARMEETELDGFGNISKTITYIYPCIDCEKITGVKTAVFVW
jgi:hypothetical protein